MNIQELIVQEGIIGIVIGTIIGTATTNFFKSIRETLVSQNKHMNTELLFILFEFGLSILVIYLSYLFIVHPLFKHQMKEKKIKYAKNENWKRDIAEDVDMINQRMLVSGNSLVFQ
jgi:uncharacterized membrane protein YciS (DUF1049 family)